MQIQVPISGCYIFTPFHNTFHFNSGLDRELPCQGTLIPMVWSHLLERAWRHLRFVRRDGANETLSELLVIFFIQSYKRQHQKFRFQSRDNQMSSHQSVNRVSGVLCVQTSVVKAIPYRSTEFATILSTAEFKSVILHPSFTTCGALLPCWFSVSKASGAV